MVCSLRIIVCAGSNIATPQDLVSAHLSPTITAYLHGVQLSSKIMLAGGGCGSQPRSRSRFPHWVNRLARRDPLARNQPRPVNSGSGSLGWPRKVNPASQTMSPGVMAQICCQPTLTLLLNRYVRASHTLGFLYYSKN